MASLTPPVLPKKEPTTPKSKTKKGGALKPTEQAQQTEFAKNSKGKSLSGLPIGTPVLTGQGYTTPIYTDISSRETYANLDNPSRANLLFQMSKIAGLYSKNDILASANAESFIRGQGSAVTFRPEDFVALDKLMVHADLSGETYTQSIQKFIASPGLSQTYFGKPTAPKTISLSNPAALELDINSKFLDMFDAPVDKKTATAYSSEIIKAQKDAGGANKLDPKLAESIFQRYVTKKANTIVDTALESADPNAKPITSGAFGITVTKLRNAYADNHLPVDDKKVYKDAIAASRSPQALQNIMQNIQMKATQYYPAVAEGIKNGLTVADILNAPITAYATTFGIKSNQVPQSFLSKIAGGQSILPQEEVDKVIWNSDGIEKTQAYQQMRANDLKTMISTFGLGPI